mgnify:CR=1 FL=1
MNRNTLFAACFAAALLFAAPAHAAPKSTAPAWFEHKELSYPSEDYVSAIGEGGTEGEARGAAVAQIALFFNTTAEVCNDLLKAYNESQTGALYTSSERTAITERSRITSQADFFGVQFTAPFATGRRVYVLAFINRAAAFAVYEGEIQQNCAVLEQLLSYAEDTRNLVTGLHCAKSAVSISALTAALVKNARLVRNVDATRFSRAESLIERSYAALKTCRESLCFTIAVAGDWQGTVYATLAELLEARGYAVAAAGDEATSTLSVQVTADERTTAAGVFLYANITVTALAGDGKPYFSYARRFDKKGARAQADAYRLTYAMVCDELKKSFIAEFDERTQVELK